MFCEVLRSVVLLQVLAYSQKARESSMYEQAALNERMQEYRRKIDQERRRSFNGSPNGDVIQPFSRSSHKLIEAVMQSAAEGKACSTISYILLQLFANNILLLLTMSRSSYSFLKKYYLSFL